LELGLVTQQQLSTVKMAVLLRLLLGVGLFVLCSMAQDGEVFLDASDKPTGKLSPLLFGMNLFQGLNPAVG
jgi:hypothetical protein